MCCGEEGCQKVETAGNNGDNINNVQTLTGGSFYPNNYCPQCPHCRKCPTCGKDGYTPPPPYVIPNYYPYYYPWWQTTTVPYTVTTTSGAVTPNINQSNYRTYNS